ncbi:FxsA family membrane protein [Kitasatospora sp. CM 4170]|uniref:FxsA family membrane protein n=1 Tax=Kitasatospora aburaviensis TaxID=67265 RepID=A0ABW1ETL5_9ACTN|nr:FxsA family membrane protein [Kitasatospora sp. CM 4170]WNM44658.1 FxsA family membrane protein [Kitasatospora sp. CM 4170]
MTQQATPVRPAQRGRLRRMLPLLITAWLVLEIWLLVQVGSWLGGLTVVLLLLAGALIGGSLIKRAGAKALSAAIDQSRDPKSQQPQTGTSLTVLAGLLLIVPGFLSDVLALTLLFPPTRALWRAAGRRFVDKALRSTSAAGTDPLADAMRLQEQLRIHRPDGKVIQGEVVEPGAGPGAPQGPDTTYRPPLGG